MDILRKDDKEGRTFEGKIKRVSWERLWAFSGGPFAPKGWPKKNIHTDLEFAKSCGLPSVAASATQYQAYVIELMVDLFGCDWLSHGTMDAKFIKVVDAGDLLLAKAKIKSKESMGLSTKFILEVSCVNQKGDAVLVGLTTGIIGKEKEAKFQSGIYGKKQGTENLPSYEPFEFLLTPELNQQYLFSVEDFHPCYIQQTEIGTAIGHPGLLLNMSNATRSPSFRLGPGQAGIHAADETFFYNAARIGKKIRVTWKILDKYEKRGRNYQITEGLVSDEDGLEILRKLSHSTFTSLKT